MNKRKKVVLAIVAIALDTVIAIAIALQIVFFMSNLQRGDAIVTQAAAVIDFGIFLSLLISLHRKRVDARHRESHGR